MSACFANYVYTKMKKHGGGGGGGDSTLGGLGVFSLEQKDTAGQFFHNGGYRNSCNPGNMYPGNG